MNLGVGSSNMQKFYEQEQDRDREVKRSLGLESDFLPQEADLNPTLSRDSNLNRFYNAKELRDQLNPSTREPKFIESDSKSYSTGGRKNFGRNTPSNYSTVSKDQ